MTDISPNGEWMPLTLPQLDFWEEFEFHPDQPVSTVAHYVDIKGTVDERALRQAISQTIREAEILSARFRLTPDDCLPRQTCDPEFVPALSFDDLRTADAPMAAAKASMEKDLTSKLDLRRDKLSAHCLYRVANNRYLWYIRAHHIIVDGYGLALIEQRCAQLYSHFCGMAEAGLPFHSLRSFIEEENRYQGSRSWELAKDYWTEYFRTADGIEVLERGDEDYGGPGLSGQADFSGSFAETLRDTAAAADIGWPDLLTLVSGLYLYTGLLRSGDRDTQTVWLPFMSRWGSVGAHLPALLVNILPFQACIQRTENLEDFLKRSTSELRRQRRHGRYRIEQISEDMGLEEGSRYFFSPLINVLPFNSPVFEGCSTQRQVLGSGPGDGFNLTFRGEDDGSDLVLYIDADPSATSTEQFERHLTELPSFLKRTILPEALELSVGDLLDTIAAPV